jgi:hypothetical protein
MRSIDQQKLGHLGRALALGFNSDRT